jgi:hypothetical protein
MSSFMIACPTVTRRVVPQDPLSRSQFIVNASLHDRTNASRSVLDTEAIALLPGLSQLLGLVDLIKSAVDHGSDCSGTTRLMHAGHCFQPKPATWHDVFGSPLGFSLESHPSNGRAS